VEIVTRALQSFCKAEPSARRGPIAAPMEFCGKAGKMIRPCSLKIIRSIEFIASAQPRAPKLRLASADDSRSTETRQGV